MPFLSISSEQVQTFICFFSYHHISQNVILTSSRSNWTEEGSITVFLRKPIATCDFPGERVFGLPIPPSGSAHACGNPCDNGTFAIECVK